MTAWSPGGNPVELKFILFGQLLLISNLNLSIALPDVIVWLTGPEFDILVNSSIQDLGVCDPTVISPLTVLSFVKL